MGLVTDIAYLLAGLVTMPYWLIALGVRGKLRTDWPARLGLRGVPADRRAGDGPRILIHAVSVGEVNAIRLLADQLAAAPLRAQVTISSTTDTGLARARSILGARHQVVRFPIDFSWAMRRLLSATEPDLVLLAELELWPNFMRLCSRRGVPVAVVNGRLSERSFARSRRARWVLRESFGMLARVSAQDQAYADRFVAMGTPRARVHVGGTLKWDTASAEERVAGASELAREMGIDPTKGLVVGGSTAPGEEALLAQACPAGVQLLCAPRKPEWFDSAAEAMGPCVRRSRATASPGTASTRFLLDTIGELRKAYALADLVVIGRSFGNLHGSDMMEPAALGKAVVVGPRVGDFAATAATLLEAGAMVQTTPEALKETVQALMNDPARRRTLGERAREVVRREQGATARNVAMAGELLQRRGRQ